MSKDDLTTRRIGGVYSTKVEDTYNPSYDLSHRGRYEIETSFENNTLLEVRKLGCWFSRVSGKEGCRSGLALG